MNLQIREHMTMSEIILQFAGAELSPRAVKSKRMGFIR